MNLRLSLLGLLFLCACGLDEVEVREGAPVAESADEASALSSTELKAATTGITAWLKPYAVREERSGRAVFVLRGRASVNLEHAFSYVPDDGFCETTMRS